jgi:hypothetical protein
VRERARACGSVRERARACASVCERAGACLQRAEVCDGLDGLVLVEVLLVAVVVRTVEEGLTPLVLRVGRHPLDNGANHHALLAAPLAAEDARHAPPHQLVPRQEPVTAVVVVLRTRAAVGTLALALALALALVVVLAVVVVVVVAQRPDGAGEKPLLREHLNRRVRRQLEQLGEGERQAALPFEVLQRLRVQVRSWLPRALLVRQALPLDEDARHLLVPAAAHGHRALQRLDAPLALNLVVRHLFAFGVCFVVRRVGGAANGAAFSGLCRGRYRLNAGILARRWLPLGLWCAALVRGRPSHRPTARCVRPGVRLDDS